MKLSTSVAVSILAAIDCVYGFKDTAPAVFQVNHQNKNQDQFVSNSAIQKYAEIFEAYAYEATNEHCSQNNSNNKLFVFQVKGLTKDALHQCEHVKYQMKENKKDVVFSPHVLYAQEDIKNKDSYISESCSVKRITVQDEDKWLEEFDSINDEQVVIFEVNSREQRLLDVLFNKLSLIVPENMDNFIIQGLPTFKLPEITKSDSIINKASKYLGLQKRTSEEETDETTEDYEIIEEELKEAFEEVDEMIDDELVSIYSAGEEKSSSQSTNSVSKLTIGNGSVVDNYGFFSTGIWMGTIVSLFLVYVLVTALGWLSSLQISYKAFEKPPNAQKKTQ